MKAESYFLGSTFARETVKNRLDELELSGSTKITISDQKDKTDRCRGLQWRWNTDVANSGMGGFDTKEDVHRAAKWKWAIPILNRDDEVFAEFYEVLLNQYQHDKEKMKLIVDRIVSTETKGFAIGEYLTDFERFYRGHGVPLTTPDDGLLKWANDLEAKRKKRALLGPQNNLTCTQKGVIST
jgi:hypothetical protein